MTTCHCNAATRWWRRTAKTEHGAYCGKAPAPFPVNVMVIKDYDKLPADDYMPPDYGATVGREGFGEFMRRLFR